MIVLACKRGAGESQAPGREGRHSGEHNQSAQMHPGTQPRDRSGAAWHRPAGEAVA